jgi:hypothetical protein
MVNLSELAELDNRLAICKRTGKRFVIWANDDNTFDMIGTVIRVSDGRPVDAVRGISVEKIYEYFNLEEE